MECLYFLQLLPSGLTTDADLRVEGSGKNRFASSGPWGPGRLTQILVSLCKRSPLAKGLSCLRASVSQTRQIQALLPQITPEVDGWGLECGSWGLDQGFSLRHC